MNEFESGIFQSKNALTLIIVGVDKSATPEIKVEGTRFPFAKWTLETRIHNLKILPSKYSIILVIFIHF